MEGRSRDSEHSFEHLSDHFRCDMSCTFVIVYLLETWFKVVDHDRTDATALRVCT